MVAYFCTTSMTAPWSLPVVPQFLESFPLTRFLRFVVVVGLSTSGLNGIKLFSFVDNKLEHLSPTV
jgi:hypothetical protein